MLMAQAIRPPASPVGSVLSDTHSMNPGNGASSSILPGSEEGIGGRHGFPHTLAVTVIYNEWIENTADLDAGRYRFAPRRRAGDGAAKDGGAFAGAPTAITSAAAWRIQPFGTQEGKPIPLGWALDREGHPTTDPKAGLEGAAKSTRSALKPAFGHAAGRKCPLARATAAAIWPTGRAGRAESF
jgi:hypothetical protein